MKLSPVIDRGKFSGEASSVLQINLNSDGLFVILSRVSNANRVEESRTAAELAKRPEDQWDEGSSSRGSVKPVPVSASAQRSAVW